MIKTTLLALLIVSASVLIGWAQGHGPAQRYLRPDDFKTAPQQVRANLNRRHCLIPQDVETAGGHNLIQGEFAKPGQQDWAAYCSINRRSTVVMIWGGPSRCSGEPFGLNNSVADDQLYRDADPQQWGRMPRPGIFWTLSVVPGAEVVARQKRGIAIPPLLKTASHDALQRKSVADLNGVYCENGKWRELWYAD